MLLVELKAKALADKIPIIQDAGLAYLIDHLQRHNVKSVLELGCAVGYSAIALALSKDDVKITTLEKDEIRYNQALSNIEAFNLGGRIKAELVDISTYHSDELFDLIFVDAAKGHYYDYLKQFLNNLKVGGYFIFDNIAFHGLTKATEIKSRNLRALVRKINDFVSKVSQDENYEVTLLPDVGDGLLVLRVR